jgi:hypothetical protein
MEQLKVAWLYRFWIIVGIATLLPIISYFVDTQKLSRNAKDRANTLKGLESGLEKAAAGPNPNDNWVKGVTDLKDELSKQVDVAWIDLYKKQAELKTWPENVRDVYTSAGPLGEDKVPAGERVDYQESYQAQLEGLFNIVQPIGFPKSKGLVVMDRKVVYNYRPAWADIGTNPPNVRQAWLAQEDIWLLRAVLGVVSLANQGSTKWQESAVKQIQEIEIGNTRSLDGKLSAKNSREQLQPRGGYDAAPGTGSGSGLQAAGGGGGVRSTGGEIRGTLYSEVPIFVRLIVDQPRILQVLAAFGNSEIPMQVKQVQLYEIPLADRNNARLKMMMGEVAKKEGSVAQGAAPAQDDEYFQMAGLDVWARAVIYKKPPKVAEEEKKAAEAAKSAPAGESK